MTMAPPPARSYQRMGKSFSKGIRMPSTAISRELLSGYQGLHISKICTAVAFVDDAQNHCAHFVNHVLGVSASLNCGQLRGRSGPSANIRVHETFALCPVVGNFKDRPAEPCLAFVVQRNMVDLAAHRMTNVPKKHIGIFCDGEIWHYSNTQRKVVRQSPEDFARHFSGDGFALFFGTFPADARALAAPGVSPAPGATASSSPVLERGQPENVDAAVWQQFLIVRQLLNGPNIRALMDGKFGEQTEDATQAFQIAARLDASGVVNADTYLAAIEQGFIPRSAAPARQALTQVTAAMTEAAVDALHRLGPSNFFYKEEELNIDGQRIIARLEPHKHTEGTQLRFWHRGITLYAASQAQQAPSPGAPAPAPVPTLGHAGLDTSVYPGDAIMSGLLASTNLTWTGFYLGPAPSHPNTSWMNKRSALLQQGWGLAPIYVGQQESGPGSHQVNGAQGTTDGTNAVSLAQQAEFPPDTIIYLDIEQGGPLSPPMRDYVQRWCAEVKSGGYTPGAYLSHLSAASARQAVPDLKLWVFRLKQADFNVDKSEPFRDVPPSESGVTDAVAWQWAQNCRIPAPNGGKQLVDLNVASTKDPSRV